MTTLSNKLEREEGEAGKRRGGEEERRGRGGGA
jgi:hypothetical protein